MSFHGILWKLNIKRTEGILILGQWWDKSQLFDVLIKHMISSPSFG